MAGNINNSAESGSKALGLIWLLVSIGLAYPAYQMLVSIGFNQALAGVAVFIGACLLYEIPYRVRVKERHEASLKSSQRWRGRSC